MLRILGIDPGSRITGYGLIDSDGVRSLHIEHGALRLEGETLPLRLGQIYARVSALIEAHHPAVMAIEQVFVSKNAASALKLGQARGAAICAAIQHGLDVAEYTPTRVKQSVVGSGRADKGQIQHMVKMILNLSESHDGFHGGPPGGPIYHITVPLQDRLSHVRSSQRTTSEARLRPSRRAGGLRWARKGCWHTHLPDPPQLNTRTNKRLSSARLVKHVILVDTWI
jgi:crossover junction endodeoxyribonuclease RuvC